MGQDCALLVKFRTIIPELPVSRIPHGVNNLTGCECGVTFTVCERFSKFLKDLEVNLTLIGV